MITWGYHLFHYCVCECLWVPLNFKNNSNGGITYLLLLREVYPDCCLYSSHQVLLKCTKVIHLWLNMMTWGYHLFHYCVCECLWVPLNFKNNSNGGITYLLLLREVYPDCCLYSSHQVLLKCTKVIHLWLNMITWGYHLFHYCVCECLWVPLNFKNNSNGGITYLLLLREVYPDCCLYSSHQVLLKCTKVIHLWLDMITWGYHLFHYCVCVNVCECHLTLRIILMVELLTFCY